MASSGVEDNVADRDSDDSDYYIGPVPESTDNENVQECAKQAVRQFNAEQEDEQNYYFLIKVLSSHSFVNIGRMHYIRILMGKSAIFKEQTTQKEFEMNEEFVETDQNKRKTILAECYDCKEDGPDPARIIKNKEYDSKCS